MTLLFCDTETTGIDPAESGAFEIAFLVYEGAELKEEKVFYLNPLNEKIHFSAEAFKINGVSEDVIRSYPSAETIIPEIVAFLETYAPPEKLVFAGYKCSFDYGHLSVLLSRCGFDIGDYCNGKMIDVLEVVKKAKAQGVLSVKTRDNKLTTMTKAIGVPHEDAHTALSDIKATRLLYEAIYCMYRGKNTKEAKNDEN